MNSVSVVAESASDPRSKILVIDDDRDYNEGICESLELFGADVLPEFAERSAEREQRKQQELAPFLEQALSRKQWMKPIEEEKIPELVALGRQIMEKMSPEEKEQMKRGGSGGVRVPLNDPNVP